MRIWTSIERAFHFRPDGLWQEYFIHKIHSQPPGASTPSTAVDKKLLGKVFREASPDENLHSFNGEAEWFDQNSGRTLRLLALTNNQQR